MKYVNLVFLIAFFVALLFFIFFLKKKSKHRFLKFIFSLILFMSLIPLLFMSLLPMNPISEPEGTYDVLNDRFYISFTPVKGNYETSTGLREIPINVWKAEGLNNYTGILIFSHGANGVDLSNEDLFVDLASRGYYIISLSHPYHSFVSEMSDGRKIFTDPDFMKSVMKSQNSEDYINSKKTYDSWLAVREDDINNILNTIFEGEFPDKAIDDEKPNIFLAGHSLGGSAVTSVARKRPEDLKGVIALESPLFGDITGADEKGFVFNKDKYSIPVLNIYSDASWPHLKDWPAYEGNLHLLNSNSFDVRNVHIEGIGHLGLTDLYLTTPVLTNLFDGELDKKDAYEALEEINKEILKFLEDFS